MYEILVYLFENCQQAEVAHDRERVAKKLSAAGFENSDISEALRWLPRGPQAPAGPRGGAGAAAGRPGRAARVAHRVPRVRATRTGEARCGMPRLPDDARAFGNPQPAYPRARARARTRRLRRRAQPRAAGADRADGAVEPEDAAQPAGRHLLVPQH